MDLAPTPLVVAVLLAAMGCGPRVAVPEPSAAPLPVDGHWVLVSDGDQAGTAYAFGRLRRVPGVEDALSTLVIAAEPEVTSIHVSNSVVSWPQVVDLSADGTRAYVIETRARPPDGVDKVGDVFKHLPEGTLLSIVALDGEPRVLATAPIATNPEHVSVSPDGRWLVVNTPVAEAQLVFVPLDGDAIGEPQPIVLTEQAKLREQVTGVRWHPEGRWLATMHGYRDVAFYAVSEDGGQISLQQVGEAVRAGDFLSSGTFTPDGAHFVVSDTNWRPNRASFLFNGRGRIATVAFSPDGSHRLASVAKVGRSTEGFALSPSGNRVVAVSMNRTYLPRGIKALGWPRGGANELTLLALDPQTGVLTELHGKVGFPGVLPEDAAFDADGDMLAVLVYHDKMALPDTGWVELWRVDGDRLIRTDVRIPVPRGPHDIELVPGPGSELR